MPSKDRGEVNAFQDKGHIEVKEEDENSNGNVFLNLKLCAQRRDREEQRETYNKVDHDEFENKGQDRNVYIEESMMR